MKTKHVQYETHGTCSRMIDVTADENNVIQQVFFRDSRREQCDPAGILPGWM